MSIINKGFDEIYKKFNDRALRITVEAFEKSKEARELKQKLGDAIPGSKYYRCFCYRCGTPMRTYSSQLFSSHWCRYCSPGHQGVSAIIRISRADKERWAKLEDKVETHIDEGTEMMPLNFKDKMTEREWKIYSYLHPQSRDLSIQDTATKLGISTTSVFLTIKRIKEKCKEAFSYERDIEECESGAHNIEHVYEGNKAKAKQGDIEFTIPLDDFINVVQLECFLCGRLPNEANREKPRAAYYRKTGFRFSYNYLWRLDLKEGFTTKNCTAICAGCIKRKTLEAKSKKIK